MQGGRVGKLDIVRCGWFYIFLSRVCVPFSAGDQVQGEQEEKALYRSESSGGSRTEAAKIAGHYCRNVCRQSEGGSGFSVFRLSMDRLHSPTGGRPLFAFEVDYMCVGSSVRVLFPFPSLFQVLLQQLRQISPSCRPGRVFRLLLESIGILIPCVSTHPHAR